MSFLDSILHPLEKGQLTPAQVVVAKTVQDRDAYARAVTAFNNLDKDPSSLHALTQAKRFAFYLFASDPGPALNLVFSKKDAENPVVKSNMLDLFADLAIQNGQLYHRRFTPVTMFASLNKLVSEQAYYQPATDTGIKLRKAWLQAAEDEIPRVISQKDPNPEQVDARNKFLDLAAEPLKNPDFQRTAAAFLTANGRYTPASDEFIPPSKDAPAGSGMGYS